MPHTIHKEERPPKQGFRLFVEEVFGVGQEGHVVAFKKNYILIQWGYEGKQVRKSYDTVFMYIGQCLDNKFQFQFVKPEHRDK